MLLSDRDLRTQIEEGSVVVEPFDDDMIQPSSIDIRLDRFFRVFINSHHTHIDPTEQQDDLTTLVEKTHGIPFILHPGEFVLGSTYEYFQIPGYLAGRLEGKSSLGRLGLIVHSTSGFIDAGFKGTITLELSNIAKLPIMLWPEMRIGQLCLFRLSSATEQPYGSAGLGSRYQNQDGPTASLSYVTRVALPRASAKSVAEETQR